MFGVGKKKLEGFVAGLKRLELVYKFMLNEDSQFLFDLVEFNFDIDLKALNEINTLYMMQYKTQQMSPLNHLSCVAEATLGQQGADRVRSLLQDYLANKKIMKQTQQELEIPTQCMELKPESDKNQICQLKSIIKEQTLESMREGLLDKQTKAKLAKSPIKWNNLLKDNSNPISSSVGAVAAPKASSLASIQVEQSKIEKANQKKPKTMATRIQKVSPPDLNQNKYFESFKKSKNKCKTSNTNFKSVN